MKCAECNTPSACYRYKCCELGFCGTPCYKIHSCKVTTSDKTDSLTEKLSCATSSSDIKASLKPEQIAALRADTNLRSMLKNELLRKVLSAIARAPDPSSALEPYMKDEFFSSFVTQLLGTLAEVEDTKT